MSGVRSLLQRLNSPHSTGKSTVTQRLREEHKLRVIDLDSVARQVVEPNTPALRSIADRYGDRVLKWDEPSNQHTLNRPALARILFDDKAEKKWIESVLHPEILKRTAWEVGVRCETSALLTAQLIRCSRLMRVCRVSSCSMCPSSLKPICIVTWG